MNIIITLVSSVIKEYMNGMQYAYIGKKKEDKMVFKHSTNNQYNIGELIRDSFILCFLEQIAGDSEDEHYDMQISSNNEE